MPDPVDQSSGNSSPATQAPGAATDAAAAAAAAASSAAASTSTTEGAPAQAVDPAAVAAATAKAEADAAAAKAADDAKQAELAKAADEKAQASIKTQLETARNEWAKSAKVDTEIGGDKFAENLAVANSVFNEYGTPELGKLLDASGLGQHPEVLRWAYRVGKALGPDRIVQGRHSEAPTDTASVLYGAPAKAA